LDRAGPAVRRGRRRVPGQDGRPASVLLSRAPGRLRAPPHQARARGVRAGHRVLGGRLVLLRPPQPVAGLTGHASLGRLRRADRPAPGRGAARRGGLPAQQVVPAPGLDRQTTRVIRSAAISPGSVTESNETTLTWLLPNLSCAWFFRAPSW